MVNNSFEEIWNGLIKHKKIITTLHALPDLDSLASCTSLKYILERTFGQKVDIVSHDNLSEESMKHPYCKEVNFGKDISEMNFHEYDALVCLDCEHKQLSGKLREKFELPKDIPIVNIDHHDTNSLYGNFNYVDPKMPSNCAILSDLFKNSGVKFDKELSERLLLGVCSDSGFFTYAKNPQKSLETALFLINQGADYHENILKPILYNQSLKERKIVAHAINSMKIYEKKRFAYCSFSQNAMNELNSSLSEIRIAASEIEKISNIDFVCVLGESNGKIKGSFRSNKGIVDVSKLATELGGGGHPAAASFFIDGMNLNDAEQKLVETIDNLV